MDFLVVLLIFLASIDHSKTGFPTGSSVVGSGHTCHVLPWVPRRKSRVAFSFAGSRPGIFNIPVSTSTSCGCQDFFSSALNVLYFSSDITYSIATNFAAGPLPSYTEHIKTPEGRCEQ